MRKNLPGSASFQEVNFAGFLFPYYCFFGSDGFIELWKVKSLRDFKDGVGELKQKTRAKTLEEARAYLPLKKSPCKKYAVPVDDGYEGLKSQLLL